MSNTDMWSLIVGFLLPLGISLVQQAHWPVAFRSIIGFLMCLVAATGTVLIQVGSWDWHDWVQSALIIFVTAIATYQGFWKKTGVAPAIESATSPVYKKLGDIQTELAKQPKPEKIATASTAETSIPASEELDTTKVIPPAATVPPVQPMQRKPKQ